jgi:hypothetical protein
LEGDALIPDDPKATSPSRPLRLRLKIVNRETRKTIRALDEEAIDRVAEDIAGSAALAGIVGRSLKPISRARRHERDRPRARAKEGRPRMSEYGTVYRSSAHCASSYASIEDREEIGHAASGM